jgi:hypothetical protein
MTGLLGASADVGSACVPPLKAPRGARCQTRPYNNKASLGSLALKEPNAEIQLTSIVAATAELWLHNRMLRSVAGWTRRCVFVEHSIDCRFRSLPGDVAYWPDSEVPTDGPVGPLIEVDLPCRRSEWHGSFWPNPAVAGTQPVWQLEGISCRSQLSGRAGLRHALCFR